MGALTREAILGASDLRSRAVAVPEWGGDLVLSEMSGVDREDWDAAWLRRSAAERAAAAKEKRPADPNGAAARNYAARIVVWTARTSDGADLFPIRRPDGRIDVELAESAAQALSRKSGVVLDRLARVAEDLNGWGARAAEAVSGNSEGTPPV